MSRRFRVGLVMGLGLGLGLSMLLAPSSGAETRQKLRERAKPAMEMARQRIRRNAKEEESMAALS